MAKAILPRRPRRSVPRRRLYPNRAQHRAMAEKHRKFQASCPPNRFVDVLPVDTINNVRSVISLFQQIREDWQDIGSSEQARGALIDINLMLTEALDHASAEVSKMMKGCAT